MLCGAEEACWAHNPKVVGSKPTKASLLHFKIVLFFFKIHYCANSVYKQQVIKTGIRRYFGNYVYLTTSGVSVQFYSISKQEGTCSVGVF
jgi:hypothetical protein